MKTSDPIELEFTHENLIKVLLMGKDPKSSLYCHKQIAEWCERFWNKYNDIDAPAEIENIMPVLADIETQWDLYLANTYSIEQLQTQNFEDVELPKEWFQGWLNDTNA